MCNGSKKMDEAELHNFRGKGLLPENVWFIWFLPLISRISLLPAIWKDHYSVFHWRELKGCSQHLELSKARFTSHYTAPCWKNLSKSPLSELTKTNKQKISRKPHSQLPDLKKKKSKKSKAKLLCWSIAAQKLLKCISGCQILRKFDQIKSASSSHC